VSATARVIALLIKASTDGVQPEDVILELVEDNHITVDDVASIIRTVRDRRICDERATRGGR
jgi:hypothetical protein